MNTVGNELLTFPAAIRGTWTTHPSAGRKPSRVTLPDACQASSCTALGRSELIPLAGASLLWAPWSWVKAFFLPHGRRRDIGHGGSVVNRLAGSPGESSTPQETQATLKSRRCGDELKILHKAASIFHSPYAGFKQKPSPLQEWFRICTQTCFPFKFNFQCSIAKKKKKKIEVLALMVFLWSFLSSSLHLFCQSSCHPWVAALSLPRMFQIFAL